MILFQYNLQLHANFCLNLYVDGKIQTAKEIIEEVDDETHKIVFKVIESELLQVYNALTIAVHIEDRDNKQVVVWSINFEKVNANIPDPTIYLDMLCACTKDMDAYILKQA